MTKIDDLIETLVSDLTPVSRHALRARLATAFAVGIIGAVIALLASLRLHSHLHHVTAGAFLVKFSYTAVMMTVMTIALDRVARPGGTTGIMLGISVAAFVVVALLAVIQLAMSPSSSYEGLIFGFSASICPILIFAFGLPAFFANMWFLRRAAPLRPGFAGLIAGACAGAIGGWVYSWACVENGIPFIGIWYTLGIVMSGALGWLVGKYSLRW